MNDREQLLMERMQRLFGGPTADRLRSLLGQIDSRLDAAEPQRPVKTRTVVMPRAEFEALLEYSSSIPTGVVVGKRWRRKKDYYDESQGWLLGEYAAIEGNDREVAIKWSEISIAEDVAAEEARQAAFAALPRDEAQRQIDERLADLKGRIRELPLAEKLRLAADMLETEGLAPHMPLAIIRLALNEAEAQGADR